MSEYSLSYDEHDRRIWEEDLAEFIPAKVFDAHCHLLDTRHLALEVQQTTTRPTVKFSTLRTWSQTLYPGRKLGYLILGMPIVGVDEEAHTQWALKEIANQPLVRYNRLVTPRCEIAELEKSVINNPQIAGFKPYRIFSVTGDIHECRIHEFITHEQLELANKHALFVTMHLSRSDGCADNQNLNDLSEYTHKRYPRIRWILAHCARSFTYYAIRRAVDTLRDMPNIFYDISAVTDLRPHLTLFQREDLRRIFYGSDGVGATSFHGSYVSLGRAWQTFDMDRTPLPMPHTRNRPILCIYEELLAIKHAAEIAGLSRSQIQDIFWNNAVRALGIPE